MTLGEALRDARWYLVALLLVATGAAVGATVSTALFYSSLLALPPPPPAPAPVPKPCPEVAVVALAPPPAPEEPKAAPFKPVELAYRTVPVLSTALDGEKVASNGRVTLRREQGAITIGNGRSAFRIRVDYVVKAGALETTIDSEPSATLFDGDAQLGRTPLKVDVGRLQRRLSFRRPNFDRVTLFLQVGGAAAAAPAPVADVLSAPPPPAPPAPAGKTLLFKTSPSTPVRLEGKPQRELANIALGSLRGTLEAGDASSPFAVKFEYAITDGALSARLDAEPWAIAYVDGVSKGKVPVMLDLPDGKMAKVDLKRPGSERELTILVKPSEE